LGRGCGGFARTVFAKALPDVVTGEAPLVTYWKQSLIESADRLSAPATSRSTYTFGIGYDGSEIDIKARLLFRRLFQDVTAQKGWNKPDIVMEDTEMTVSFRPSFEIYLSMMTAKP
jgi:hypothetical protein